MYFWALFVFLYYVKCIGASFLSQPTNATIRIGDSVLIDCKIEHDDISNRSWYINGSFTDQNSLPTGIFSRLNGLYIAGKYSKYYNQTTFQCSYVERYTTVFYSSIGRLTVITPHYTTPSTIAISSSSTSTTSTSTTATSTAVATSTVGQVILPSTTNDVQFATNISTEIHYRFIILIVGVSVTVPTVILLILIYILLVIKRRRKPEYQYYTYIVD